MSLPVLARFTLHHKVIRIIGHFTFTISAHMPTLELKSAIKI
jgi:hypothetical protein